jgi:hypothetical protein
MPNQPRRPLGGFGGPRLIIYALVAILAVTAIYMRGESIPEWERCKESLIQQFFSNQCTPRDGLGKEIVIPASPGQNT